MTLQRMLDAVRADLARRVPATLPPEEWARLTGEALAGRPAPLWHALHVQRAEAGPDVLALVAELRRVRPRGRPRAGADERRDAAREWQRHEARMHYRHALRVYTWARDADDQAAREGDSGSRAREVYSATGVAVEFGPRSRGTVVRGRGLPPKEYAIEAAARAIGRTPEAVRRLLFGKPARK